MDIAPKSSDGESKDGSSSEPQLTEPMDTSIGVGSSLLGKRKIEATNVEDPGDREGDDDEDDDSEDPNWDKDSFDDREYHSSDDQGEFDTEALEKSVRSYRRLVIETKGFFDEIEIDEPLYMWSGIATVTGLDEIMNNGLTGRQFLANMASQCVEKLNKLKGKNVKFEHILRANFNPGGITKYYITFAARESDSLDAPLVEYQAKVDRAAGKTYPILCRPTSPLKLVEVDGDQLKSTSKVT